MKPHPKAGTRSAVGRMALACLLVAVGCSGASTAPPAPPASDAEWRALALPRPEPMEGAAGVTVGDVALLAPLPWDAASPVEPSLAVSELVATGLIRRRDLEFVERRRFSAAAEAERQGRRPPGQPPAGVSRRADYLANATWIDAGAAGSSVEISLVQLASGVVAGSTRIALDEADPVILARTIVSGIVDVLDELGRRPAWSDPLDAANVAGLTGVSGESLRHFLRGLAAEEGWQWEAARRGYQQAAENPGFHEAESALARTARLRLGGTLAESRP